MVASSSKVPSVFPIFSDNQHKQPEQTFHWIEPALGPSKTCLHGVNLAPKASSRIAAFDLDGCLIESTIRQKKTTETTPSFQWWRPVVPKKLKEVHSEGYAIVIVTNQALRGANAIKEWKKKIPLIGAALPDVPFHILAATAKDAFRKPIPGMWYELERIFAEDNVTIDKTASLFVGDAAGRKVDHAGTDRKWALNVGIPFFTPEEYFLKFKPTPYTLQGFHPSSLLTDVPHVTPTSSPIVPTPLHTELVLFVGPPAIGKSRFYRAHFAGVGYVHVNQDTLGSRDKCVRAAREALEEGRSVVVDNTNRDSATRGFYITIAQKLGVPVRCFHFVGSSELAWHNNLYRAYNLPPGSSSAPKRDLLPYSAITSFRAAFKEPTVAEGFSEVRRVNWVFEGTDEERARWGMWLQIDGK
ncbi:hypothetical protein PHLGIDRAFT_26012 [Phlebiopsis gigantea 11061_1 CR5-6]|uniref:PNK FHA domain-containing protein n=1 Tax=Phlebiopsis gigantea (strain 11061_1 CR5-6) TaxID=745531 RepID=A0A0C3S5Q5_PHLG1|nr:hypothetical protein PHLGIDRAFT_26012 [Phlebiopsis gigantea 11061_1 CR5-6]